ncbi:MAG: hypothetical protein WBV94_28840 [Blastocatellia bacterium]
MLTIIECKTVIRAERLKRLINQFDNYSPYSIYRIDFILERGRNFSKRQLSAGPDHNASAVNFSHSTNRQLGLGIVFFSFKTTLNCCVDLISLDYEGSIAMGVNSNMLRDAKSGSIPGVGMA